MAAVAAFMAIILYATIAVGVWPTFDLVVVGVAVLAILVGRSRLFFTDWVPFLLISLA